MLKKYIRKMVIKATLTCYLEKMYLNMIRVEAYGTSDETCSFIGYFYEIIDLPDIRNDLFTIINDIFIIESHLANKSMSSDTLPVFSYDRVVF